MKMPCKPTYITLLAATILLFLAISISSCRPKSADGRPVISVSIPPIASLVEAIAGEHYQINILCAADRSAETYEPTPQQMVALADSRLCLFVGTLGFEQTLLSRMVDEAGMPPTVSLCNGIKLLPIDAIDASSDSADAHVWLSVLNQRTMARNLCNALSMADTLNAAEYAANLLKYESHLDSLDQALSQQLQTLTQRTLLVHHPALGYYCRDYNLRQISIEQNGKEPSAARLAELLQTCRRDSLRLLFVELAGSHNATEVLRREAGLHTVEYNPLNANWEATLQNVTEKLVQ